jgi:hypothetical protein
VYRYPWHTSAYLLTWVWYAAVVVLGRMILSKQVNATRVIAAPVIASTSFFLISNFAVWAGGGLYPHTMAGLSTCFVVALPFFRNDVVSTVLVTGLAFGLPAMAARMAEQRAHRIAA